MANVKFAYGTTTPTTSTSGFDDGCIYFNTSSHKIYLRQNSLVYEFDGNNSTYTNMIKTHQMILATDEAELTNPQAMAVDGFTSSEISIAGIMTGWSHSGAGTAPKVVSRSVSYSSSGATTKVKFAASFTGKGTARFQYWYIPNGVI